MPHFITEFPSPQNTKQKGGHCALRIFQQISLLRFQWSVLAFLCFSDEKDFLPCQIHTQTKWFQTSGEFIFKFLSTCHYFIHVTHLIIWLPAMLR